tara:strand:- start:683 stop:895 length:213 start_codon:yes stop_codon:yes gene_type:complete
VRVWGNGFGGGTDYRCKLSDADVISAAHDEALDCITCFSDLWQDGSNKVEVTLNGREYSENQRSIEINIL